MQTEVISGAGDLNVARILIICRISVHFETNDNNFCSIKNINFLTTSACIINKKNIGAVRICFYFIYLVLPFCCNNARISVLVIMGFNLISQACIHTPGPIVYRYNKHRSRSLV